MSRVRDIADRLELLVDAALWPLPKSAATRNMTLLAAQLFVRQVVCSRQINKHELIYRYVWDNAKHFKEQRRKSSCGAVFALSRVRTVKTAGRSALPVAAPHE